MDKKNLHLSKDKNSQKKVDWDDESFKPLLNSENPVGEEPEKNNGLKQLFKGKKERLHLDDSVVSRSKTRSRLAQELISSEEEDPGDLMVFASPLERVIATVFDLFFLYAIFYVSKLSIPFLSFLLKLFLDHYKLAMLISPQTTDQCLFGVALIVLIYLFIVIPLAFFNNTFGKKFLGLKVRGNQKYSLSLKQAFLREIVYKPLSMISVVGLFMILFSKEKLSLHDRLSQTLVIKE